jgi:hypothetical protein
VSTLRNPCAIPYAQAERDAKDVIESELGKWSDKFKTYRPPPYRGEPDKPPPQHRYDDPATFTGPRSFFDLFFDDALIDTIVAGTNENIGVRKLNGIDPAGADVTADDIRALFGVLLRMGAMKARLLDDYWDTDIGWDPVRTVFSAKRFRTIFRSLSVSADAPQPNPSDRLAAVQHFVDELNKRFAAALIPGEWVCIDETMIEFRGDHDSVQFLPKKPIPLGFKCFTISTSFGYVLCQRLYEGKTGGVSDTGLTERLVLELMEPYGHFAAVTAAADEDAVAAVDGPHRIVVMDSFYSGVPLFKKLFDDNTLAVGRLSAGRALYPKELNKVTLTQYVANALPLPPPPSHCRRTVTAPPPHCTAPALHTVIASTVPSARPSPLCRRGSDTFAVRQNVNHPELICVACKRKGKRVLYLSTATDVPVKPERYKPNDSDEWLTVPSVVPLYNRRMWTVDCSNKYVATDTPHRRSPRWWLSIVLHYFHVAVVNAYLLYSKFGHDSLPTASTFHAFRKLLADELVAGFDAGRQKIGRPSNPNTIKHTPRKTDEYYNNGRRKDGWCVSCSNSEGSRGAQVRTGSKSVWKCLECDVWVCFDGLDAECWVRHLRRARGQSLS